MIMSNINLGISKGLLVVMLIICGSSMQLSLKDRTTCLEYEVDSVQNKYLFSYHLNPHIDQVNMIIYDKQTKILNQTGSDINYHAFIQIQFNETGLYPICFQKLSQKVANIQFDILNEQQKMVTAGKQDINKLSKKISEFLIDIRKTGWEFKQILEQHNNMKNKLKDNQTSNYWIFASKMTVMMVFLMVQFYAVKYFFQ